MKCPKHVYVVTMYRYGDREKHSYVLGAFTSYDKARATGENEEKYRGGKYKWGYVTAELDKVMPDLISQQDLTCTGKVEVEVEGETQSSEDDNDNTDRLEFLNDFEEISGIAYPVEDGSIATRQRVIEINNALMRMMQAGVTKAIMKQAIKEMDEKNYKIKDLLSIENACMMILAKKQRTGIATEDFSQFIRR